MMTLRNDCHCRTAQDRLQAFQDNIEHLRLHPPPNMEAEQVQAECRVMRYRIEKFRFQLRAYEDVQAGRTCPTRDRTDDELAELERSLYHTASRETWAAAEMVPDTLACEEVPPTR